MGDYIDRQKFREIMITWRDAFVDVDDEEDCSLMEDVITELDAQTHADVKDAVYGHWEPGYYDEYGNYVRDCSKCHKPNKGLSPYCPNCGADMRGEMDETNLV